MRAILHCAWQAVRGPLDSQMTIRTMSHLLTTFLNSSLASTHRSTRASLRILSLPWNPVLRHFISPHISFAPHISFTLITKNTFTIQIAADRSLRRPPHTQQFRSQTLAQTLTRHSSAHRSPYKPPSYLTVPLTDPLNFFLTLILASAREPPAPYITKTCTMIFKLGVSSKQPDFVAGGRKL